MVIVFLSLICTHLQAEFHWVASTSSFDLRASRQWLVCSAQCSPLEHLLLTFDLHCYLCSHISCPTTCVVSLEASLIKAKVFLVGLGLLASSCCADLHQVDSKQFSTPLLRAGRERWGTKALSHLCTSIIWGCLHPCVNQSSLRAVLNCMPLPLQTPDGIDRPTTSTSVVQQRQCTGAGRLLSI